MEKDVEQGLDWVGLPLIVTVAPGDEAGWRPSVVHHHIHRSSPIPCELRR